MIENVDRAVGESAEHVGEERPDTCRALGELGGEMMVDEIGCDDVFDAGTDGHRW